MLECKLRCERARTCVRERSWSCGCGTVGDCVQCSGASDVAGPRKCADALVIRFECALGAVAVRRSRTRRPGGSFSLRAAMRWVRSGTASMGSHGWHLGRCGWVHFCASLLAGRQRSRGRGRGAVGAGARKDAEVGFHQAQLYERLLRFERRCCVVVRCTARRIPRFVQRLNEPRVGDACACGCVCGRVRGCGWRMGGRGGGVGGWVGSGWAMGRESYSASLL
jgi:hypothetical protein